MITVNDQHTKRLFDLWGYVGPEIRKLLDSTIIRSNMRELRRIRICANTIPKFHKKLKRKHSDLFDTLLESEFADCHFAGKSGGCFLRVKHSELL